MNINNQLKVSLYTLFFYKSTLIRNLQQVSSAVLDTHCVDSVENVLLLLRFSNIRQRFAVLLVERFKDIVLPTFFVIK